MGEKNKAVDDIRARLRAKNPNIPVLDDGRPYVRKYNPDTGREVLTHPDWSHSRLDMQRRNNLKFQDGLPGPESGG